MNFLYLAELRQGVSFRNTFNKEYNLSEVKAN